jgi:ribosome-binding factor A
VSRRTDRVASILREEIANIIRREVHDPRLGGILSITRVKVSSDLSVADVSFTYMGTPGQQSAALAAMRQSAGMFRSRLTKELSMRTVPQLKFHLDENLKKELEVLEMLEKVRQEREQSGTDEDAGGGAAPAQDN